MEKQQSQSQSYDKHIIDLLKNRIEKMDKIHHIEILKILTKYNKIKLNENKSGVFVNMSFLPVYILEEINKYIEYVNEQERYIHVVEEEQEKLKHYVQQI